jgi:hypothetical protein
VRLGPLNYATFDEFLPDRSARPSRKAFFAGPLGEVFEGKEEIWMKG